jgi:hypothetical protein
MHFTFPPYIYICMYIYMRLNSNLITLTVLDEGQMVKLPLLNSFFSSSSSLSSLYSNTLFYFNLDPYYKNIFINSTAVYVKALLSPYVLPSKRHETICN